MKPIGWVHIAFFEGGIRCARCGEFTKGGRYAKGQSWNARQGRSERQSICLTCLAEMLSSVVAGNISAGEVPPAPPSYHHPERN